MSKCIICRGERLAPEFLHITRLMGSEELALWDSHNATVFTEEEAEMELYYQKDDMDEEEAYIVYLSD